MIPPHCAHRYYLRPRSPRRTDAMLSAIYDALPPDLLDTLYMCRYRRRSRRVREKGVVAQVAHVSYSDPAE